MQTKPSILYEILANDNFYYGLAASIDTANNIAARDGISTMINVADWVREKEVKSYVVSDSLLDALEKVDCEEVGPWHLSGMQFYHFIFKKNKIKDEDNNTYNEMYLGIIPPNESFGRHINRSEDSEHKITLYLLNGEVGARADQLPSVYLGSKYKGGYTLEDIMNNCKNKDLGELLLTDSFSEKMLRLAFNLVLYIHSADPNIMRLKPQVYNTKKFKNEYFQKSKNEKDLLGIYSLGWDFHGKEYHISVGARSGHMRWQRCGKQWSQVKLIYIAPTTVNYKKEKENG